MDVPPEIRALAESRESLLDGDAVVVDLSKVEPESIKWLWEGWLALGKVGILDGDPGLGKSMMTIDIAARVSKGGTMPDGSPGVRGGVVILSAEDGLSDTIRPRLDAAGADPTCVRALVGITMADAGERMPEFPGDLDRLEQAAVDVDAKLIIVDPLMAYLGGDVDSHRDQGVRRALAPLARVAERTGAAVLVVRHLNKSKGGDPLHRGGGSIGIIAAARTGLLLARDPDDESRRVLAVTKCNVGPESSSLSLEIETTIDEVPVLRWLGVSEHTAASLLASAGAPEADGKLREAMDFLLQALAAGRVKEADVSRQARGEGISHSTLKRAKRAMRVRSIKGDFDGGWWWELPNDGEAANEEDHSSTEHPPWPPSEDSCDIEDLQIGPLGPLGEECQGPSVDSIGSLGLSPEATPPCADDDWDEI